MFNLCAGSTSKVSRTAVVHSGKRAALQRVLAKRRQHDETGDETGEVDEVIYHIDEGWSSEEFLQMAQKLEKSLHDRTGREDGADSDKDLMQGDEDSEDDVEFSLESILQELKGGMDPPELVYSTEGDWEVTAIEDDENDDDSLSPGDFAALSSALQGDDLEASFTAADGSEDDIFDDGWGVVEVEENEGTTVASGKGREKEAPFKLDFRPTLDELDPSTTQLSSKQLLKDWAADKGVNTQDLSVLEKGGGEALETLRPHQLKKLDQQQVEAYEMERLMTPAEQKKRKKATQRHQGYLKIIAGSAAGKRLYSPADERTRPMMEKVRGALFSMLLAQSGGAGTLPPGCRWLDCYAGTGAVGLEGLSRGADQAHFIEMDPWVIRKVLDPNIKSTGLSDRAVVHTMKAEDFLRRAHKAPMFAGGPFDFISITPPYMLVSYPEIYDLLEGSPLIHERSVVIVEYAKQNLRDIRPAIGPLKMVKDRKYGRTFLAIYANVD